ncbi:MAG TPA: PAS domain S-box protein [Geobacteraceae bacterium]|nr:PAS domain S-box protein [Geobacteraceae bacterium]
MTRHHNLKQFIQTGSEAILEAIGDAISIQDKDLKIILQNKAHVSMLGKHSGEYCYTAYQGKSEPCQGCHLLESFKDGKTHRRQTDAVIPGRGKIHVEIVSTPLRDDQGEIVGGIESVRDITDRVVMEEKLIKQLAAIETSMDGIAILNSEGKYVYLNQAHATVYGYNFPGELIGSKWDILYDSGELERLRREIMPLLMKKGAWKGEATGRRKDGTFFPQELSLNVTEDNGIVCVVRDVSERKDAERRLHILNLDMEKRARELMVANSELESFSYTLSHDIRTYLTQILLAVNILQEHSGMLDETGRFVVKTIGASCNGMEKLIEAILVLSHVGKSGIANKNVDLSELAIEVGSVLRTQHPEQQVEFTVQPGLATNGDRKLLRVMLVNLLGNAWKYTSHMSAARVTFGIEEHNGKRVFFVRDNGPGFYMHEAEKLFKPFSRLGNARDYEGTGIGLATVQRIVHAHGGEIWGMGEPGKGATFYFTL